MIDLLHKKAKQSVLIAFPEFTGGRDIKEGDLDVFWFSKARENWAALVSTDIAIDVYFEAFYDATEKQTRVCLVDRRLKKGPVIVSDQIINHHNN